MDEMFRRGRKLSERNEFMRKWKIWLITGFLILEAGLWPASLTALAAESEETIQEERQAVIYPKGSYIVGKDIPEGEYAVFADSEDNLYATASFSLYKDDTDQTTIGKFSVQNHGLVHLYPGQHLVITRGWAVAAQDGDLTLKPAGMYLAGRDIEPGTYRLTPLTSEGGYAAVYRDVRYYYDYQVSYRRFYEPTEIQIEEGQYLELGDVASIELVSQ